MGRLQWRAAPATQIRRRAFLHQDNPAVGKHKTGRYQVFPRKRKVHALASIRGWVAGRRKSDAVSKTCKVDRGEGKTPEFEIMGAGRPTPPLRQFLPCEGDHSPHQSRDGGAQGAQKRQQRNPKWGRHRV